MATYDITPAAIASRIEQFARNFNYRLEHSEKDVEDLRKDTTRKLILQMRGFVEKNPELAGVCADLLRTAPQKFPAIFSPLPIYFEAAGLYNQADNAQQVAEVYSTLIARTYMETGDLINAFEAFRRSVGIYYSLNMRDEISEVDKQGFRQSFGAVLDAALDPDSTKVDSAQIKFWLDYGMTSLLPELYKSGKFEEALSYYNRTLDAMQRYGDTINSARIRCRQGRLLYKLGRIDESRNRFVQAFNLFSTLVFKASGSEVNGIIDGELYFGMQEFVKSRQVDLALMLLAQYEGSPENTLTISAKLLKNVIVEKYAHDLPCEVARYVFFVAGKLEHAGRPDLAFDALMLAVDVIDKGEVRHKVVMHEMLVKAIGLAELNVVSEEKRINATHRFNELLLRLREVSGDEPFNVRRELRRQIANLPPFQKYRFPVVEIDDAFKRDSGKMASEEMAGYRQTLEDAKKVIMFDLTGARALGERSIEKGL